MTRRRCYEGSTVRVPDSSGCFHAAWSRDGAAHPLRGAQLATAQLARSLRLDDVTLPGARRLDERGQRAECVNSSAPVLSLRCERIQVPVLPVEKQNLRVSQPVR